jgi:hypothetical protein
MRLPINHKEPSEIPEVADYLRAVDQWNNLRDANQKLFETLDSMLFEINQKAEAARNAVKAADVSCGVFEQISRNLVIDGDLLFTALGNDLDLFIRCGGTVKESIDRSKVDLKRYNVAKAQGLIPPDVCNDIESVAVRYKSTATYKLP